MEQWETVMIEQRLVLVRELSKRSADGHKIGLYLCMCGETKKIIMSRVRHNRTRSCGCLEKECMPGLSHGMTSTPEYRSWQAMKRRCINKNDKDYPRYGGAGITIYKPWIESFEKFYNYIGPRPKGASIDRIDNTKGYRPGNVRWATRSEQRRNSSSAKDWFIKGRHFPTAQEAADYFGVTKTTVVRWVNGFYDARRDTFTEAREDCYARPRY